jgi:hypothetical protein
VCAETRDGRNVYNGASSDSCYLLSLVDLNFVVGGGYYIASCPALVSCVAHHGRPFQLISTAIPSELRLPNWWSVSPGLFSILLYRSVYGPWSRELNEKRVGATLVACFFFTLHVTSTNSFPPSQFSAKAVKAVSLRSHG